jgi:hypothetical protein
MQGVTSLWCSLKWSLKGWNVFALDCMWNDGKKIVDCIVVCPQ